MPGGSVVAQQRFSHLVPIGGADRQGVADQQSHVVLLHRVNETKWNNDLQGRRENRLRGHLDDASINNKTHKT